MVKYITLTNEYYEILIDKKLKKYGEDILEYATKKLEKNLMFFKEKSYGKKIKCSFFTNRNDFIERIKSVSNDNSLPPKWATGCFYGGEIQILLNEKTLYNKLYILAHESFHLLFDKFVYQKNNFDRIIWLDESLASNFDGRLIEINQLQDIIIKLSESKNIPKMNELSFSKNNIVTQEYNGYDLFKLVGKYLIETKTMEELFNYIKNKEQIINDGENIFEKSLNYFIVKYDLKK